MTDDTSVPFPDASYDGTYDPEEVGRFLDGTVVPLRLSCRTRGGELWMLSLWFLRRDGALWCATGRDADVVGFLEADPEVAFEVSTNDQPYRGVRGHGRAAVRPDEDKALLRDLLERYRGGTDGPLAERLLSKDREEVRLRIAPDRLYSWDFTERMRE